MVTKADCCELTSRALHLALVKNPDTTRHAFAKCGLYPVSLPRLLKQLPLDHDTQAFNRTLPSPLDILWDHYVPEEAPATVVPETLPAGEATPPLQTPPRRHVLVTVDDGTPGTIPYSASPATIRRIIGVYIAAVDERSPGANTEGVQNSVTSAVRDDVVLPNRARDDAVKSAKAAKPPKRKRTFTSGAILTSSTYVDECVADKAEEAKAEEVKAAKAELKAAHPSPLSLRKQRPRQDGLPKLPSGLRRKMHWRLHGKRRPWLGRQRLQQPNISKHMQLAHFPWLLAV